MKTKVNVYIQTRTHEHFLKPLFFDIDIRSSDIALTCAR